MQEIINLINVVVADVTTFSGAVKRPENTDQPEVYTAGSLRVIDPKHLRPFLAARQAINRACLTSGTRFLGGFAMPDQNLEALLPRIKELSDEISESKEILLSNYEAWVEEWADAHPLARDEILARAPKLGYVAGQVGFSLRVFKINPQVEAVNAVGCQDGIADEVGGLVGQITNEIAQDVRDSWSPFAESASQRIRSLLKRVSMKARSLAFIDGRLGEIASFVEETVTSMPTSGRIAGRDFLILSGLMGVLSSPDKLLAGNLGFDLPPVEITPHEEADGVEVKADIAEAEFVQETDVVPPVVPPVNTGLSKSAYAW